MSHNYSGKNPDKFRTEIRNASDKVDSITEALKASGVLAWTQAEVLARNLEKEFPNTKSNAVVEFNGMKYMRKYRPAGKSRSGKSVTGWDGYWVEIKTN